MQFFEALLNQHSKTEITIVSNLVLVPENVMQIANKYSKSLYPTIYRSLNKFQIEKSCCKDSLILLLLTCSISNILLPYIRSLWPEEPYQIVWKKNYLKMADLFQ